MTEETTNTPATDENAVSLAMKPGPDVLVLSTSEVDLNESDKAIATREFDDSTLRIMTVRDLPPELRQSRGRASQLIPVGDLYVVPGMNARLPTPEWEAHIEWLTGQILENGFREDCPILAFPTQDDKGKPVLGIISGESRYRAVLRANKRGANIQTLPTIFAPEGMSAEEMSIQVATSNGGKEFTPLELANLALRFSKYGRKPSEIAKILKVTSTYVMSLLTISRAPHKVRAMLADGTVAFQVALDAMKKDPTTAVAVLEKGVAAANKAGQKKLTRQFTADHQVQKAVRANAPKMKDVLTAITKNEGVFALMDEDIQQQIKAVLTEIEEMASKTPEDIAKEREAKKAERLAAKKKEREEKAAQKAKDAAAAPDPEKKVATAAKKPASKTTAKKTAPEAKKVSTAKKTTAAETRSTASITRVRTGDVQLHPDD
ncbi:hypothetical protein KXJ72_17490 (plasmid) [Comamonas aquatica]|nr:hypothetical protein KXJ72_17490 [Comamonas aquatica]